MTAPPIASPAPTMPELPPFLEVPLLLEASQPVVQAGWLRYGAVLFVLVVVGSAFISSRSGEMAGTVQVVSSFVMVGLVVLMSSFTYTAMRGQRIEQAQLDAIEELIQLRRWSEAAMVLQGMLSQPARTPYGRVQALIYLSGVLARYHRFTDAIAVQNYLLENVNLDGPTTHALRLGRAMAMLREDHLFDADTAINELRRQAYRAAEAKSEAADLELASEDDADSQDIEPGALGTATFADSPEVPWRSSNGSKTRSPRTHESAGLALVELYRDVKTGHPAEAEAIFTDKLPILRRQLGHRVADAYVLVARAYDLMGRTEEAASMYLKATLLAPVSELHRRYPEVAVLGQRYKVAAAPLS